jgi:uncharacterized integral membrane protein
VRAIKAIILTIIAAALVLLAVANRQTVDLRLVPADLGLGIEQEFTISLPLYAVVLIALALGLCIGLVLEMARERKYHRAAAEKRRELGELRAELEQRRRADGNELTART